MCNIHRFYWLRELYEVDFHKPGIYGSGRVRANAWDVFPRMPSRIGRGRRAAVAFVAFFGRGGFFSARFFFRFFFSSNAHGLLQVGHLASFTSLLVMRQGRGSQATEDVFCLQAKKPLHTGVRTGCHYLICLSVCVCVCVTFVVFTDCESCTLSLIHI